MPDDPESKKESFTTGVRAITFGAVFLIVVNFVFPKTWPCSIFQFCSNKLPSRLLTTSALNFIAG